MEHTNNAVPVNFDSGSSLILIKSYSEEMKIASASTRTTLQVILSVVIPLDSKNIPRRAFS
jgi:hypothetical protein